LEVFCESVAHFATGPEEGDCCHVSHLSEC
jgi:hypothetical protein